MDLATLRALSFRISSTPTTSLPQHVPTIAASLASCRALLSSTQSSNTKISSESSVVVHKFRTILSTLLQDRTAKGRWSGVVLVKASIEVGGWETLQKSLPWVRGLLGVLSKPDPPSTKKLCIIVLTRIFILTRNFPTLVREITTPSLPSFIQSCLQIMSSKCSADLLVSVLNSFSELLPRHPTMFRSYLKQFQPLLAQLVAPTPSSILSVDQSTRNAYGQSAAIVTAAQDLYTQIPCSAPKGASSEEWQKSLETIVSVSHEVTDSVFRAVHEDWHSTFHTATKGTQMMDNEMQQSETDALLLPPWSGIFAGSERLVALLQLISRYLDNSMSNTSYFNVSIVVDLVSRILSLTVPTSTSNKNMQNSSFNNQISKEERDSLWLVLPDIHIAAIGIFNALCERTQASTSGLDLVLLDQLMWVFKAEKHLAQIRTAVYVAVSTVLQRSGRSLPKSSIDSLNNLIRTCCEDSLPLHMSRAEAHATLQAKANGNVQATANADTFLASSRTISDDVSSLSDLHEAAFMLLPIFLSHTRVHLLSDSLRAHLDRVAILTRHKTAMIASVLNPPPNKRFGKSAASVLPILARLFPCDANVEGLLRPRMPAILLRGQEVDADAEIHEAEQSDVNEDNMGVDEDEFVGHELDALLGSATQLSTTPSDKAERDVHHVDENVGKTAGITSQLCQTARELQPSDATILKDEGKRLQPDDLGLSTSKRVKFDSDVESVPTFHPDTISPAQIVTSKSTEIATSEVTLTATASLIPELSQSGEAQPAALSSDEDEEVHLVLGQDTDEDSE